MTLAQFGADDFGFAIIIFTFITKTFLYPLYFNQMKASARTMQLQPKILEIRRRWGNNQEKVTMETSRLYIEEGISPWAPLLPSFA